MVWGATALEGKCSCAKSRNQSSECGCTITADKLTELSKHNRNKHLQDKNL